MWLPNRFRRAMGRRIDPDDRHLPVPPTRWNPRGGIVLGRDETSGDILYEMSGEPVAALGPTRCGKGISVMNTTLMDSWTDSAFIVDPKGDLWNATASARGRWSHLLRLYSHIVLI